MIDLYYWTTPNGQKPLIYLLEAGLPYKIVQVNIAAGDQFGKDFLRISPNNRIPALVDHDPADGSGQPLSVFESGAILLYLGEKTGKFLPQQGRQRVEVLEWLMWQMGGLGPMLGQNHHFRVYAPEKISYATERYTKEATRLYNILNRRLAGRDWICSEYSIADMACYPWTASFEQQGQSMDDFPHVRAWRERMCDRPAVAKACELHDQMRSGLASLSENEDAGKVLFGQTDARRPDL